jgi:Flp pilus assembly protein TadG
VSGKARRSFRAVAGNEAGSTAVEFAIIAPVFFAALFGIAQFGWAFLCGHSVRSAVQKEARLLISNPATTASQIKAAVLDDLENLINPTITIALSTETVTSGAQLTRVTWNYSHPVLFPFSPSVTMDFSSSIVVPKAVP